MIIVKLIISTAGMQKFSFFIGFFISQLFYGRNEYFLPLSQNTLECEIFSPTFTRENGLTSCLS